MIEVATVAVVSPLQVRVKGSTTNVPVTRGLRVLEGATALAVGNRVLVTNVDRAYWLVSA